MPVEEDLETTYELTVGGKPVPTHQARVSAYPINQVWSGYQRPKAHTEIAAFAGWDMSAPVEVVVKSTRPVEDVQVRPRSAGITPQVDGDTIRFTITKPGQYTVEVNGTHQALHLFANPPEEAVPAPGDPDVLYFGPGVHCPGLMRLQTGQTLYIAGGAVVYGAVIAEHAEHIAILGRGILDGSKLDRMDLTGYICLYDCSDVRIEGITLRDSPVLTVLPVASRQVHIKNLKIIGNWRYNSDGIDFISCQECSVEDSFIRAFDDGICSKGYESFGPFVYRLQLVDGQWDGTFTLNGTDRHTFASFEREFGVYHCGARPIHDIQVRRCVIWNEWGRALEIGAETVASEIHDLLFEDCDIIHGSDAVLDVQNCDRALCRNITFRDIRVEMEYGPRPQVSEYTGPIAETKDDRYLPHLIVLEIKKGYASHDDVRGRIEDIVLQNISVTAPQMPPSRLHGHDADHLVQGIVIENLRLNGQEVTSIEAANLEINEFVRNVTIRHDTGSSK
jgi:hypothetical protein